jgi:hypothetical protein
MVPASRPPKVVVTVNRRGAAAVRYTFPTRARGRYVVHVRVVRHGISGKCTTAFIVNGHLPRRPAPPPRPRRTHLSVGSAAALPPIALLETQCDALFAQADLKVWNVADGRQAFWYMPWVYVWGYGSTLPYGADWQYAGPGDIIDRYINFSGLPGYPAATFMVLIGWYGADGQWLTDWVFPAHTGSYPGTAYGTIPFCHV